MSGTLGALSEQTAESYLEVIRRMELAESLKMEQAQNKAQENHHAAMNKSLDKYLSENAGFWLVSYHNVNNVNKAPVPGVTYLKLFPADSSKPSDMAAARKRGVHYMQWVKRRYKTIRCQLGLAQANEFTPVTNESPPSHLMPLQGPAHDAERQRYLQYLIAKTNRNRKRYQDAFVTKQVLMDARTRYNLQSEAVPSFETSYTRWKRYLATPRVLEMTAAGEYDLSRRRTPDEPVAATVLVRCSRLARRTQVQINEFLETLAAGDIPDSSVIKVQPEKASVILPQHSTAVNQEDRDKLLSRLDDVDPDSVPDMDGSLGVAAPVGEGPPPPATAEAGKGATPPPPPGPRPPVAHLPPDIPELGEEEGEPTLPSIKDIMRTDRVTGAGTTRAPTSDAATGAGEAGVITQMTVTVAGDPSLQKAALEACGFQHNRHGRISRIKASHNKHLKHKLRGEPAAPAKPLEVVQPVPIEFPVDYTPEYAAQAAEDPDDWPKSLIGEQRYLVGWVLEDQDLPEDEYDDADWPELARRNASLEPAIHAFGTAFSTEADALKFAERMQVCIPEASLDVWPIGSKIFPSEVDVDKLQEQHRAPDGVDPLASKQMSLWMENRKLEGAKIEKIRASNPAIDDDVINTNEVQDIGAAPAAQFLPTLPTAAASTGGWKVANHETYTSGKATGDAAVITSDTGMVLKAGGQGSTIAADGVTAKPINAWGSLLSGK